MNTQRILILSGCLLITGILLGQPFMTSPLQDDKDFAAFICTPNTTSNANQKNLFRKSFEMKQIPDSLMIYVTADQLYKLYVNGREIGYGPAISDLHNWQYDTYNIAPYLNTGNNTLAAEVVNYGDLSGGRWISERIAFLLQAEEKYKSLLNSGNTWKCTVDRSWKAINNGFIAGPHDSINGNYMPWGWQEKGFDDSHWKNAAPLWGVPSHPGLNGYKDAPWKLVERRIPPMEQKIVRINTIKEVSNPLSEVSFTNGKLNIKCPANSTTEILLDNKVLTMGFTNLLANKGKDAHIKILYAESMYNPDGTKGNRNQTDGKYIYDLETASKMKFEHEKLEGSYYHSYCDKFVFDGGKNRQYTSSWLRTYRYIKLIITTSNEPLEITDIYTVFTAYPFKKTSRIESDFALMDTIEGISWRTLRMCATDNYLDCPYYEHLQYFMDIRLATLYTYYLTTDTRLIKNALLQGNASRQYMGLMRSCFPATGSQIIPSYSLFWMLMIDDYLLHTGDTAFVKQFIPDIETSLKWFTNRLDANGLPSGLPYWNFTDWSPAYIYGAPPESIDGASTFYSVFLAMCLQKYATLLEIFDQKENADKYNKLSEKLKDAIIKNCYNQEKKLFTDGTGMKNYSEITNAMAIIANIGTPDMHNAIASQLMDKNNELLKASSGGKFYVQQALNITGNKGYLNRLQVWEDMIEAGLSTWGESGVESRSDCHVWSASPTYEFYHSIAGIQPVKPGFKEIVIDPDLVGLNRLKASMQTPLGKIEVNYQKTKKELKADILIPKGMSGTFIYNGQSYPLNNEKINNLIIKK